MTTDDDVSRSLERLCREDPLPPGLEQRVLAAVRGRGLIRGHSRFPARALGIAASLLVAFAGGWLTRPLLQPSSRPPAGADQLFLFLLGSEEPPGPASEIGRSVEAHRAWAERLRGEGRLVRAEKLREQVLLLTTPDGRATPQPSGGSAEAASGFFLVRAADVDEAVELARSCPSLRFGGSVTIRSVDPT
jgi:hypothetical protein